MDSPEELSESNISLTNSPQKEVSVKLKKRPSLLISTTKKPENYLENPFIDVNVNEYRSYKKTEIRFTKEINNLSELCQIVHLSKEQSKILVIDIDNTILNCSGLIDKETPQVLNDLSQYVRIIFATARGSDPESRKFTYLELLNVGIDTEKLNKNYEDLLFYDVASKNIEDIDLYTGITQMERGILFTGTQGVKGLEFLKLLILNKFDPQDVYCYFIDDSDKEIESYKDLLREYTIEGQIFKFVNLENQY